MLLANQQGIRLVLLVKYYLKADAISADEVKIM